MTRTRAYIKRNPTATVAGATGTIAAGLVAILGRFGITLEPAEYALLTLAVGWVPVAVRWWLDRKGY